MTTKKELRALCKERRKAINNKDEKSADIARKILAMPEIKKADKLFLFYPLEGEINLLPIAEYAWREGKSVGFPLCEDKDGIMTFRKVGSLDELVDGSFGTKEPRSEAEEIFPENAVIFLPALAIDKNGYRLGYGKGYYDRYMSRYSGFSVVLCYSSELVGRLYRGRFDKPSSAIITERRIKTCKRSGKFGRA